MSWIEKGVTVLLNENLFLRDKIYMPKLKPVIFVNGKYGYNSQNTTQQIMLLKALKVTSDPKKLRELIGVRTVAEVYRTLDKIAMRKEYHSALAKAGISFDYIVEGVKKEADNAEKSQDRLKAFGMILKSIGMDTYEETTTGGGSWEDALIKIGVDKKNKELSSSNVDYEVKQATMPEDVRLAKEKERLEGRSLYE